MSRREGTSWRALFANPWTKLLSVGLATATWLYVQGEEVQESRIKAQISWDPPLAETLTTTEPLPTQATLVVKGTRAATRRARDAAVRLVVDLSDLQVGEHTLEIGGLVPQGLSPSVELLGITPDVVRFTVDEVAARSVKVRPVLVGDPAPGFEVVESVVVPPVVEVRGPRGAVSGLAEVPTRPIDVTGLDRTGPRPVVLDLPRGVQLPEGVTVEAHLTVVSKVEQTRIEQVPVFVWGPPGWRAAPDRVSVLLEGPAATLRAIARDEVAAFVHLPEAPDRDRYEAWFGPAEGVRVEVMQPGGDEVDVVAITPPSLQVQAPGAEK